MVVEGKVADVDELETNNEGCGLGSRAEALLQAVKVSKGYQVEGFRGSQSRRWSRAGLGYMANLGLRRVLCGFEL